MSYFGVTVPGSFTFSVKAETREEALEEIHQFLKRGSNPALDADASSASEDISEYVTEDQGNC